MNIIIHSYTCFLKCEFIMHQHFSISSYQYNDDIKTNSHSHLLLYQLVFEIIFLARMSFLSLSFLMITNSTKMTIKVQINIMHYNEFFTILFSFYYKSYHNSASSSISFIHQYYHILMIITIIKQHLTISINRFILLIFFI